MVYIGIDLGGTGIKIGVVDESGAILSVARPRRGGPPLRGHHRGHGRCMLDVMSAAALRKGRRLHRRWHPRRGR